MCAGGAGAIKHYPAAAPDQLDRPQALVTLTTLALCALYVALLLPALTASPDSALTFIKKMATLQASSACT